MFFPDSKFGKLTSGSRGIGLSLDPLAYHTLSNELLHKLMALDYPKARSKLQQSFLSTIMHHSLIAILYDEICYVVITR